MVTEVVNLFSPLLSILARAINILTDADDEDKKEAEQFILSLEEFTENLLGWYNRIINISTSVLSDGKLSSLSENRKNYLKRLHRIIFDDVYHTKIHKFLNNWEQLIERSPIVAEKEIIHEAKTLKNNFMEFENKLLNLKTILGRCLRNWEQYRLLEKEDVLIELETEIVFFEEKKERLCELISNIQAFNKA